MPRARKQHGMLSTPIGLVDILRSLPQAELVSLAGRVRARIDTTKRVDAAVQVARVLVGLPEIRQKQHLAWGSAQLIRRLAEAGGRLHVDSVPPTLQPLAARGLVFVRPGATSGFELVLPIAYLVQLPTWEGEDPRCMRALLAQASPDTLVAVASHYMGRSATYPVALGLEEVWPILGSADALAEQVAALALPEQRLLEAICKHGGEVETEELLDLEREPLRLRTVGGPSPSRRGVGFSLERRAMLLPVRPNRHVVPREVYEIVCEKDLVARSKRRSQIRALVLDADHEPRRARFATDPVPLALAIAMTVRESAQEIRENAGTPRSLITRLAQRFGRESSDVALISALSRVVGLWDPAGLTVATPPGSLNLAQFGAALFRCWRQGGAWDEARAEPESLRLPEDARDESPVRIVRETVLDALEDLGDGCWVPFDALSDYVQNDERTVGAASALNRWAKRAQVAAPTPLQLAETIVFQSLAALGVVDLGEAESSQGEDVYATLVRITPRGRRLLSDQAPTDDTTPSAFVDETRMRIGTEATVGAVLALYPFVEVGKVTDTLELQVTPAAVARAVAAGMEGDFMRFAVSSVAPLSPAVAKILDQVTAVLGRVDYVPCSGFLWCDDIDVREMLRTRRQTADLFVDPSPPGGLLLAPDAAMDVLVRRCRALGVEISLDGEVLRSGPVSQTVLIDSSRDLMSPGSSGKTESSSRQAVQRKSSPPKSEQPKSTRLRKSSFK